WHLVVALDEDRLVKPEFVEEVAETRWEELKSVRDRIARLRQCELDDIDESALDCLERRIYFTPKQHQRLTQLEIEYLGEGENDSLNLNLKNLARQLVENVHLLAPEEADVVADAIARVHGI
ncbi:MAG TPA: hypothetical protein V6D33_08945, partial [Cyanophyceae cyanobacterium]